MNPGGTASPFASSVTAVMGCVGGARYSAAVTDDASSLDKVTGKPSPGSSISVRERIRPWVRPGEGLGAGAASPPGVRVPDR